MQRLHPFRCRRVCPSQEDTRAGTGGGGGGLDAVLDFLSLEAYLFLAGGGVELPPIVIDIGTESERVAYPLGTRGSAATALEEE